MQAYSSLKDQYTQQLISIKKTYTMISMLRLTLVCIAILCFYFYITTQAFSVLFIGLSSLMIFIFVLTWHKRKSTEMLLKQTLININTTEIDFLQNKNLSFEDGSEYNDISHPYTFDLDIYGKNSLFQHLNRTATHIGKTYLANSLQSVLPNTMIANKQAAIQELSDKLVWRQEILAHAQIANDTKTVYTKLLDWSLGPKSKVSLALQIFSIASPIGLYILLITSLFAESGIYLNIAEGLFLVNLIVIGTQLKTIKHELVQADKIESIILQYSLILEKIESEQFQSPYLQDLKEKLIFSNTNASTQLNSLSKHFARVQTVQNAVGSLLMNGFFLYHIHSLHGLLKWKAEYAHKLAKWTTVVGEIEMLNSYANLSYNNPGFIYPELNSEYTIQLTDAGHPLIDAAKRVNNNVTFKEGSFIILTGSNMSGKSTFLRTLGVNMVLAGAGAPICASSATIHPLPVIVSMRLSDSLSDNESYFFAEVKRLKQLMRTLDDQICFILLDEILRGTNSDDKRSGTIEVIKKIIAKQGIGIIATHDLEVCNTTAEYPGQLSNKCFEVEIVEDELVFDYKLREDICKNKSATFLMKKMGVI